MTNEFKTLLLIGFFCLIFIIYLILEFRHSKEIEIETLYRFEGRVDFYNYNDAKHYYSCQVVRGVERTSVIVIDQNCEIEFEGLASEYFIK